MFEPLKVYCILSIISLCAYVAERGRGHGQEMVLGNFQCQGILLIWHLDHSRARNTVLAVSMTGGCLDIFLPIVSLIFLSLSGRLLNTD